MLLPLPLVLATSNLSAAAESWPPDQQRYATAAGADPYQDSDLHVATAAGAPEAVSFLHFDLGGLPAGASVGAFVVTLTPNQTGGQNITGVSGEHVLACIETQPPPYPTQFDPTSTQTSWDCSRLHATVQPQTNGSWTIDLTSFVAAWQQGANNGLALVPAPSPSGSPPENWALSFDHARTLAKVDYSFPPTSAVSGQRAGVTGPNPLTEPAAGQPLPAVGPAAAAPLAQPAPPQAAAAAPPDAPVPAAPLANSAQTQGAGRSTQSPLGYMLVAVWSACATLLAVGFVVQLARGNGWSLRALGAAALQGARRKSSWLAGVPLTVVVIGGLVGFTQLQAMNSKVTPPLSLPAPSDAAPAAPTATTSPAPGSAGAQAPTSPHPSTSSGTTQRQAAGVIQPAVASSAGPSTLDGRWVSGAGTVVGYRWPYSSPTGSGTRVGRTNGADGVTGSAQISGTTVQVGQFSVQMDKVFCDGGSTCTEHVNSIMDTKDYPMEKFTLSRPINFGSIPPDGQKVTLSVTGQFTLRGVTRAATFNVTAQRSGAHLALLAQIPVHRDDYNIPDANEPGFSIDQNGVIELLMVFDRA